MRLNNVKRNRAYCTKVKLFKFSKGNYILEIGTECQTPNYKKYGICKPIQDCPILLNVAAKKDNMDENQLKFLKKSQCGYQEDNYLVCCGKEDNYISTKRPTFSNVKCGFQVRIVFCNLYSKLFLFSSILCFSFYTRFILLTYF